MVGLMAWDTLADEETINKTVAALKDNGINAIVVGNGEMARQKALEIIPKGSEVLTVSSTTVNTIGLSKDINESGNFISIREKLSKMDRATEGKEMRKIGSVPDWVVGSVHAITEDGKGMIASASGSQMPAYIYGAEHVLWIVSTQKIVKTIDDGIKRIYEWSLPLESERAKKAYGVPGSSVNKILISAKDYPGRTTIILVKERLGF
jgi:hypothetical protein